MWLIGTWIATHLFPQQRLLPATACDALTHKEVDKTS